MISTAVVSKQFAHLCFSLALSPVFISYQVAKQAFDKDKLLSGYSQFLSLFPGQTGNYIRKSAYQFMLSHCDKNCIISFGTLFSQQDTEIHEGVYIGPQCNIGTCKIEKNCLLGSGVHIMSGKNQHNFSSLDIPIRDQGGIFQKVVIGEDTWIGNGALIMANVGKKCIIGSGAVVTNDIEDFSIVAGNPAKIVKKRNMENEKNMP